jgi:hypothetical protein
VAEERFTDGDRALRRGALTSRRGHTARIPHVSHGPADDPPGDRTPDGFTR